MELFIWLTPRSLQDMHKLQNGELQEDEIRALEADLTGKVLLRIEPAMQSSLSSYCADNVGIMAWHTV